MTKKYDPAFVIAIENDIGVERTLELPGKFEVCHRCEGHGTHLNPSIGEYAYSQEEFAEEFPDEDSLGYNAREEYFKRGGIYDVTCQECGGKRVTVELDESSFIKPAHKKLLKRIHDIWKAEAYYAAERRREERYGY